MMHSRNQNVTSHPLSPEGSRRYQRTEAVGVPLTGNSPCVVIHGLVPPGRAAHTAGCAMTMSRLPSRRVVLLQPADDSCIREQTEPSPSERRPASRPSHRDISSKVELWRSRRKSATPFHRDWPAPSPWSSPRHWARIHRHQLAKRVLLLRDRRETLPSLACSVATGHLVRCRLAEKTAQVRFRFVRQHTRAQDREGRSQGCRSPRLPSSPCCGAVRR